MSDLIRSLFEGTSPALLVTGSSLAVLSIVFLTWFLVPGVRCWFMLRSIRRKLRGVDGKDREALRKVFAVDDDLAHLWNQYRETLHEQTEERGGLTTIVAVRSTTPAEAYLNSESVVDGRLRTEFFRHLPGIFTGIGIIGTFSGLIGGLRQFQVGLGSALEVKNALPPLLHEVSTAFLVSAAAITSAMLVTLIEKIVIASLYGLIEEIAHDVDARFNAGAGEEYLSRIVRASEDSASQSKILKDALVNDLRALLQETSRNQITASKEDSQILASTITGSISESLTQPMRDIAGTVKAASGDQSATASRMLQDVLSSFSQRLNELFGGQISGINELNRDTARGIRDVAQTLTVLVANIESASTKSGDMMAQRMADAVEKMDRRQESINGQTTAFVDQLRQLVAASQSETNQKMQQALTELGQQVGGMVASLRDVNEQSHEKTRTREEQLTGRTTLAVATMTGSVDAAAKEMADAATQMHDAVASLARVTTTALDKMNYGADMLNAASSSFAQAGAGVSDAMAKTAAVAGKLTELTGAMTTSASALQQATGDYRAHRDSVSTLVGVLQTVVESAKREASLTADVLARIQSATEKLAVAETQADSYLQGVSKVLGEAHQAFADATHKTLDRANTDFHSKLSSAVNLLSASIQELETTIASR